MLLLFYTLPPYSSNAKLPCNNTANGSTFCWSHTTLLTANVPGLPTFNGNLITTFANNNGQSGNMFDITAIRDVIITGFSHHPNAGNVPGHEIYYKTGTHVGFENNAAAWTLINTANNFLASPVGTPTPIPGTLSVFIPAGQTFAFYLTTTGHGVNYTNGTAVGNIYVQDANIQIREGTGNAYPFGTVFNPRIPNIEVFYRSPASISYLWSTGDTTQSIIATAAGPTPYIVRVIDSSGARARDTIVLLGSNVIIDTFFDTICSGQLYNGVGYTTDQVLNTTYTAQSTGCDSLVTVFLTVLPTFSTGPLFVPVCYGDTFAGQPRFLPGVVIQNLTAQNGCDSSVVAVVQIVQPTVVNVNVNLCPGQPYNGVFYPGDTTLADTGVSVTSGCDSFTNTIITFIPPTLTLVNDSVQIGQPYLGQIYLTDTVVYDTLQNVAGCDSVLRINLTVYGGLITFVSDSICRGQTFNGVAYQSDTTLVDTLIAASGADSIVITSLTVTFLDIRFSNTICYGGLYRGSPRFSDTIFTELLTTSSGCDSSVTDSLFVRPLLTDTVYPVICQGFSFLGFSPPNDTVVSVILIGNFGCDSLLVVDITVNDTFRTVLFDTICLGQSIWAGGGPQTATGVYTDNLLSLDLCDSTVITNLFVRDTTILNQTVSICTGQSYFAGGALQTTSGVYSDLYSDQFGCDSTVITNLIVNDTVFFTIDTSFCQGGGILAGGSFQTTTGTYQDFYSSASGCDSVVITNLTIYDTARTIQNITICEGDSFTAGGASQMSSGTYFDTLSTSNSCDSIIVTNLTVNDTALTTLFDTICEGQSLFAGGSNQTTTGTYIDILNTSTNCDSTVITNLFVYDTTTLLRSDTICEGQSIFIGGANQTTAGFYTDYYLDQNGCDSSVITSLYVIDTITTVFFDTICEGQSFFAGGANQTTSGTYLDLYSSTAGCDSLVITNLWVHDTTWTQNPVTICEGNFYFAGGVLQGSSGTYTDNYLDINGCDSTVITYLTVNDTSLTTIFDTICEGQSLFAGGANQTTTGVYIDIVPNALNCDSTIITNLFVNDTVQTLIFDTICDGNSYLAGGSLQTVTGTYFDYLLDANGCDSVVVTSLFVRDTVVTILNVQICEGQSHQAGGLLQTTTGTYFDTLADQNGCDSVLITNLTVTDTTHITVAVSICEGQSFLAGGANQTTSGLYLDILTDQNGCDSLVYTDLTVLDTIHTHIFDTICEGQSYLAGGANQTVSGIYIDILTAQNLCDSAIFTHLWVHDTTITNLVIQICEYDSVFAGGAFQDVSGIYFDTYLDQNGCDSLIITNLTVTDTTHTRVSVQICEGQSFFVGGANQSTSGIYLDQYSDINGCDSLVFTDLLVTDTIQTRVSVTICDGESHVAGGAPQTNSGLYIDILTDQNGCDSTIYTDLTVLPNSATFLQVNICLGDVHFAGGAFQSTTGIYYDTLASANGCDSVITTDLEVYNEFDYNHVGQQNISICQGDSFFVEGAWQTTTGVYIDTLYTAAWTGCDSVLRTVLTVNVQTSSTRSVYICQGQSFFVGGAAQTTPGVYRDTFTNARGCDSVLITTLSVKPNPAPTIIGPSQICGDQTAILSVPDTFASYQWTPGGETISFIEVNQQATYAVTVVDQFGCVGVSPTPFNLTVIRDFITSIVPDSIVINLGDSVDIDLTTVAQSPTYLWYPSNYLSCTTCEDPNSKPGISMTYNILVTDINGCTDTGKSIIEVVNNEIFFIPNILVIGSSNPDNAVARIYGEGIRQVNWIIYNRWGEKVFQTQDKNAFWDGTYKGVLVQPGVYSYSIEMIFEDGQGLSQGNEYRKGTITVIR